MAVLIPTYFTAECDKKIFGLGTCQPIYNLTSFEQCTIVNLPTIDFEPLNVTVEESLEETKDGFLEENFWIPGVSWRYLVVVLCLYTITIYSCSKYLFTPGAPCQVLNLYSKFTFLYSFIVARMDR